MRLAPFVGSLLICLPALPLHAATPDYLESEEPIPKSLEETRSATDSLGTSRDLDSIEDLLPSRWFPELRHLIPETGNPFFDDARFSIRPRAYYRYRDNGDGTVSEAFALGGAFGLETGYLADLVRVGITGYTSQKIDGPSGRDGSGLLRPGQESYTVLGEAYADFKFGEKTSVTAGRQRLDLPYLNAHDSRMTPNTFESVVFRSTACENLSWGFGHIFRIKERTSTDFEYLSAQAGAAGSEHGLTSAGFRYDFSENFHLSAVNHYGWDTFNTAYIETERFIRLHDDVSLKFGFQFTDQRSVGDELLGSFDSQQIGGKFSLAYRSLIASTSVTSTSKDGGGIMKPWGGSPSYNSVIISDFDRAGEKSICASLSYDFTELGLKGLAASASYVYGDTPDSGANASPDQQEFNFNIDYRPHLEGQEYFWLRFRYATNNRDGGLDSEDFRVILNSSFAF